MASEKFTPGPWYCIPEGTDEVTVFIFSEKGFEADASRDEETVAAVDCHLKADYPQDTWEIRRGNPRCQRLPHCGCPGNVRNASGYSKVRTSSRGDQSPAGKGSRWK